MPSISLSLSRRWASCWCCKVFHWCECVQKGRLLFHKLIPVALMKFKSWETRLPGLPAGVRVPSAKRPEKYQTNSSLTSSSSSSSPKSPQKSELWASLHCSISLGNIHGLVCGRPFQSIYHFLDAFKWNHNAKPWQSELRGTNEGNLIFCLKEVGEEPQCRFNVLMIGMHPELPLLHQTNIPFCFGLENTIVTLFA